MKYLILFFLIFHGISLSQNFTLSGYLEDIETGESLEQGAIREVEEECGISELVIEKHLMDTYHLYELEGQIVVKQSVWFLMHTDDHSELIPQTEENITEARWMTPDEIKEIVLNNTYPSIKELVERG